MSKKQRPAEQEAVNTTIVGGRPPGCGKPVGDIPRGIEVLVKKATIDPSFRELLLAQRATAANEIELDLDPAEAMMLNAVPAKQLEGIIDNTVVPPKQRKVFRGGVAAAMLLAIGATVLTGCDPVTKGVRPDKPKPQPAEQAKPEEAKPKPPTEPLSRGVRPDRPPRLEPTDGIRPDDLDK